MSRIVNAEKKKNLCARLARIEGQLRGLQKLIEADADCEKIAQQMAAARKALDKSFFSMVGCMIEQGDQSPHRPRHVSRAHRLAPAPGSRKTPGHGPGRSAAGW